MSKLTERQLFDKAWEEKTAALNAQTTPSFRKKFPATSANAARLLALMHEAGDRGYQSIRNSEAFRAVAAEYEKALIESAAVMRILRLVERYVTMLAVGGVA